MEQILYVLQDCRFKITLVAEGIEYSELGELML
jgi:hypothetical protein